MKRVLSFILMFSLLAGIVPTAGADTLCALPETLKTVPATMEGLFRADEMPPYIRINSFSADDSGAIHLEIDQAVPRLRILEQDVMSGVESTIFSKKNADTADTHKVGKFNSIFIVRMIWKIGKMDYVREYTTWSGFLSFTGCTATEEADPAPFAPYTSAVRTLHINEMGVPYAETWKLENETDRFTRTATYDWQGQLSSVRQTWESVALGEYQYIIDMDKDGNLTALTAKDKKNSFYAKSVRLDENADGAMLLSIETLDSPAFDDEVASKYPQLALGLISYESDIMGSNPDSLSFFNPNPEEPVQPAETAPPVPSTMTDLTPSTMTDLPAEEPAESEDLEPIPGSARLWALNFGSFLDPSVYAFITTEPLLLLKDGKAVLNTGITDVNGRAVKLRNDKITTPVFETAAVE